MRARRAMMAMLVAGWLLVGAGQLAAQEAPAAPEPAAAPEAPATPEPAAAPGPSEEPAPEAPATARVSVLRLILRHSGPVGWVIIVMSVVAIYVIVRFFYYLRRSQVVPDELVRGLAEDLENGRVREAVERCNRSQTALARVMRAALSEIRGGYDEMVSVMEEAGEAESVRLHQQVGWLSIIGAIAPMLGLTGTVLGMMGAFGTISQMETQPPPRLLAANIQQALVTTCEGLIVAVPVLLAYAAFRNRVTTLMLEVGVAATDLLSRFKGVEITPAMVAGVSEAAGAPPTEEPPEEVIEEEVAPPPPPPE